jgi:hypothetical protein
MKALFVQEGSILHLSGGSTIYIGEILKASLR